MLTPNAAMTKRGGGRLDWFGVDDEIEYFDLRDLPTTSSSSPIHATTRTTTGTAIRAVAPTTTRTTRTAPRSKTRPASRVARPVTRLPAADGGDTALLIDLENYCPGSRRPTRVASQLRQLLDAAGPVSSTVAVAATAVAHRQRHVLATAGITVLSVPAGHNAADEALITEARRLARTGVRRFIVASGDHIFARVASFGELVVITHATHEVSRRLSNAASEVRVAA